MTLYQYDMHLKTGYCTLCSHDLNELQVDQVRSALMVLLLSHAQLYERIELKFTLGKRDLVRNDSRSK